MFVAAERACFSVPGFPGTLPPFLVQIPDLTEQIQVGLSVPLRAEFHAESYL